MNLHSLSHILYGDSQYYWSFYLLNKKLRESGWPLTFQEFEKYIDEHPDYQYFIKPYPGEPFGKFKNEYFPNFRIKNVTPILEENHIWPMLNICDIHIGIIMSIIHTSLLLKKEFIDLSKTIGLDKKYLSIDRVMNSKNKGVEDN